VISLVVLCGEICDSSLLFKVVMVIFLEGFTLFSLAGHLLIVMVTISGCIQFLWGCCVCFELPFGRYVSSRDMVVGYSPGRGIIFVILAST